MSNSIFEEEGKKPVATAQQQIEKQARQLAYDTRYQVKKQIGDKKVNPAMMKRLLIQRLQKSTSAPNVKARAKQMLLGEDYIVSGTEFATESVANAMFKVFVEGKTISEETVSNNVEEAYLSEMEKRGGEKFKVRVTDPKTGNSYIRYATMEKITQLRLKGLHVEKTKYGTPREDEARRGSQTASALGGGKKAKRDYDRDGKVESSSKEHAGAVHNAIQRATGGTPDGKDTRKTVSASYEPKGNVLDEAGGRHGGGSMVGKPGGPAPRNRNLPGNQERIDANKNGEIDANDFTLLRAKKGKVEEEFLADGSAYNPDANAKEIKPMKEGEKNKVTVFPSEKSVASNTIISAGTELDGPFIAEKAMSRAQQRFMGMVYAAKKGEKPASPEVAAAAEGMTKKEAKKFAKTKHKGLPEKVAEAVVDNKDPRDDKAYIEVIKNKFRALGDKKVMVYAKPEELEKLYNKVAVSDMIKSDQKNACETTSYKGEFLDERRAEDRGKPRGPEPSAAFKAVSAAMGSSRMGVQPRGKKKVPGQKPPAAGEYGSERRSPAQQVAKRRADAQRSQEMQSSRFD